MNDFEYRNIVSKIKDSNLNAEEKAALEKTIDEASGLTKEQYDGLKAALDDASESTVPYPVVKDDVVAVFGDANNTELRAYDYEIIFDRPKMDEDGNLVGTESETKTYKNVFVKPRQNTVIVKWLANILPYFYKVDEDGNQVNLSKLEVITIFGGLDVEILDMMYDLVGVILGVPKEDIDYMRGSSVVSTLTKFVKDNPQTANEAISFFS